MVKHKIVYAKKIICFTQCYDVIDNDMQKFFDIPEFVCYKHLHVYM